MREIFLKSYILVLISFCRLDAIMPPTHQLDAEMAPSLHKYLAEHDLHFSPEILAPKGSDRFAVDLARRLRSDARNADSLESKKALLDYVVYSLASEEPGVWHPAIEALTTVHANQFSAYSIQILSDLEALRANNSFFEVNIAKVYGAAQIEYDWLRENLRKVDDDFEITKKSYPLGWTSMEALAKNGDPEAIRRIVEYVRSLPESWYLQDPSIVSHDFRYVAQPEVVDILVELLHSDKIHTFQLNPTRSMDIPAASYAAETLSIILADFPYPRKLGVTPWSMDEIKQIREWINSQSGELKIIDHRDDLRPTATVEEPQEVSTFEESIPTETVIEKHADKSPAEPVEVVVAEPTEEPTVPSSNWWLWLIGVAVVVGGIGLAVRRKS